MMVRHARFAFDDEFQQPDPEDLSGFTDEDDRMLEDYLSSPRSQPKSKKRSNGGFAEPRRHLADADWTNPNKESTRSRESETSS